MLLVTIQEVGRLIEARYKLYCTREYGEAEVRDRQNHITGIENRVAKLWIDIRRMKSPYQAA